MITMINCANNCDLRNDRFQAGELLFILDDTDSDWWVAKSEDGQRIGKVPKVCLSALFASKLRSLIVNPSFTQRIMSRENRSKLRNCLGNKNTYVESTHFDFLFSFVVACE